MDMGLGWNLGNTLMHVVIGYPAGKYMKRHGEVRLLQDRCLRIFGIWDFAV